MSRWKSRLAKVRARRSLVLGAVVALTMTFALPGIAAIAPSTFEGNDGNLVVDAAGTDWCNLTAAQLAPTNVCPTASQAPGFKAGIDLQSGTSDNSFGQGTKEDNANVTVVTGSIPPNKSDLT